PPAFPRAPTLKTHASAPPCAGFVLNTPAAPRPWSRQSFPTQPFEIADVSLVAGVAARPDAVAALNGAAGAAEANSDRAAEVGGDRVRAAAVDAIPADRAQAGDEHVGRTRATARLRGAAARGGADTAHAAVPARVVADVALPRRARARAGT